MANRRKSDKVHELKRTFRKDRHQKTPANNVSNSGVPLKPAFIKGPAATEWTRVVKELKSEGVVSVLDKAILVQYCLLWGELHRRMTRPKDDDEPLSAAWHNQFRLVQQELGFTPASRTKVNPGGNSKKPPVKGPLARGL